MRTSAAFAPHVLAPDARRSPDAATPDQTGTRQRRKAGLLRTNYGFIPAQTCMLDVDGDGIALTFTDVLLLLHVSLGFTGDDVTRASKFFPGARRFVWPTIRDYLVNRCGMVLSPL